MTEKWLDEAVLEIEKITDYYAMRDPGEEVRFVHYLKAAIRKVMREPTQQREFEPPFRRMFLEVFPHQLIYAVEGDTVWFIAVAHPSRQKGYWKGRY